MSLEITDLCVRYPGQAHSAVEQVSLRLATGQIGVLIGPSGCGKTTVLRAVAGLEPLESGTVSLAGRQVSSPQHRAQPETRRVGIVFQDYALFPHMNVQANIGFGLHAWSRSAQKERIDQVLQWVGLQNCGLKFPHELSGGQQQRVALARAMAPKPDVLLLDEPFSSLDVDLRARLAVEVRELLKSAGTTALFVTHDQAEAFALGDQVGLMHQGQLHQWDTPYALYHAPASRFVATFVGQGVFLQGRYLDETGQNIQTELGVLTSNKVRINPAMNRPPDLCEVLVRPDDVLISEQPDALQAVLVQKAFRGADYLYTLRLPSGNLLNASVPSHLHHTVGNAIGFQLQLEHLITFPLLSSNHEPS